MDTDDRRSVLVTGGRGFIGRAVGKLLQRTGYKVVSLDVVPLITGPPKTGPAVENELLCDLTDARSLRHKSYVLLHSHAELLPAEVHSACAMHPCKSTSLKRDMGRNHQSITSSLSDINTEL